MLENYINCINTALTRLTSFRPHILIDAEAYRVTAFEGGPLVIRNPTLMNGPLAGNIIYRASRLLSIEVLHYSVLSLCHIWGQMGEEKDDQILES